MTSNSVNKMLYHIIVVTALQVTNKIKANGPHHISKNMDATFCKFLIFHPISTSFH